MPKVAVIDDDRVPAILLPEKAEDFECMVAALEMIFPHMRILELVTDTEFSEAGKIVKNSRVATAKQQIAKLTSKTMGSGVKAMLIRLARIMHQLPADDPVPIEHPAS